MYSDVTHITDEECTYYCFSLFVEARLHHWQATQLLSMISTAFFALPERPVLRILNPPASSFVVAGAKPGAIRERRGFKRPESASAERMLGASRYIIDVCEPRF